MKNNIQHLIKLWREVYKVTMIECTFVDPKDLENERFKIVCRYNHFGENQWQVLHYSDISGFWCEYCDTYDESLSKLENHIRKQINEMIEFFEDRRLLVGYSHVVFNEDQKALLDEIKAEVNTI